MSEDALKIILGVCAFFGGLILGMIAEDARWRSDCEKIGAHASENAYDCKPKAKP
jgi:hypothetical protein